MVLSFADQIAVEQAGPSEYVSRTCPGAYGNNRGIAFGGCSLAIATSAAHATVPERYFLYSLVGSFLGPATTTAKLHCQVVAVRDTKTFATRRVVVRQRQPPPDGTLRACLEVLADFHVAEPALLTYSAPPSRRYQGPREQPTLRQLVAQARADGVVAEDPIAQRAPMFYAQAPYWDIRTCVEGMAGQNLAGVLPALPTDQDRLPLTDRVSADWIQLKAPLASTAALTAALAFLMDGAVPYVALAHNHLFLTDCGPCNTLEFAMRLFEPVVDLTKWHLRERKTIVAGHGRSFNEARLFDERGNLAVSMTQQCILRPKPEGPPAKASL